MMQSYDDLSRFMVFGIQPVECVQALPALLRVSPLYDAGRFRRRQRHRAMPIPLSNIYERSLSVKEKTKISSFPSALHRKKKFGSRNTPTVITGASATSSATVFSKKRSSTSAEPMKLRTSFGASATISISLLVPSTRDMHPRSTLRNRNRYGRHVRLERPHGCGDS